VAYLTSRFSTPAERQGLVDLLWATFPPASHVEYAWHSNKMQAGQEHSGGQIFKAHVALLSFGAAASCRDEPEIATSVRLAEEYLQV
jgi:hypothetical protein